MFRRNGLPTRLLTAALAIAMAWATTPTQGLAEALTTTPQTQTTASAPGDASSDASASNKPNTPTGEKDQGATPSKSTMTGSDSSSSNDGEKAGAADEKDTKSNGNSGAAALAAPAAPSQDTSDNKDGQSTFTAHWTNAPDKEISYTNAGFKKDDSNTWTYFSCTPSENSLHKSTLNVYLKLAGDSKTTYKRGSVKIYVPAGFYRGLDKDDPLLVACTDSEWKGSPLNQIEWMIPKAPNISGPTDFNYTEETRKVNGQQVKYYVMQNAKDLAGATELDVDIDYRFRPTMLDVKPNPQADGSDMGKYQESLPVSCAVNGKEISESNLGVCVSTRVNQSSVTLTHGSQDSNGGVFFTWDDDWGKRPADADKCFYIVWYANYHRAGGSTMPYSYRLNIDGEETDGGELIGVKKFTGGDLTSNAYQHPIALLRSVDSTYKGIEGNLDILNNDWIGISAVPTKTNDFNANMMGPYDMSAGSLWQNQLYILLFKYPMRKIEDAVNKGVDMVNEGIAINNGITVTETWQDGHKEIKSYKPSGDTSVKALPSGGGKRGLSKSRALPGDLFRNEGGFQSLLSQGHDLVLEDYTLSSYNYDDKAKWDSENNTYSATTGFEITDGSYYLGSGDWRSYYAKKPGLDSISQCNPVILNDNEYSLTSFYLDDSEYDGRYFGGLGWQRDSKANSDYDGYQPIEVWVRKRDHKSFNKFGEIQRTAKGYEFTGVDGARRTGINSTNRVPFPEETVQVKIKQEDSRHYASDVSFHYGLKLHPDQDMVERLQSDIDMKMESFIGGFASGFQTVGGASLGKSEENMASYWNQVSYGLTPIWSGVQFGLGQGTRSDDEQKDERRIPVTIELYNETSVYQRSSLDAFANTNYMRPYIPQKGTFYVLLPAGTYIRPDEVTVSVRWNPVVTRREVQLLPNWQNTGRTMLEVSVDIPEEQLSYNGNWSGLLLRYTLHDTYTNIVDRGGLVTSSAIFVNSTGQGNIFNSNAKDSSYTGKDFDDWEHYKGIAQDAWLKGHQVATAQSTMDFGNVTALQAGFTSRVSTDINPVYQAYGVAYLGDSYIDCLQYASSSSTRTDDIILYDVFSPEDKNRVGSFEGIDVSSIESKPTYDLNNSKTTDTCKPVVYYATQLPTDKTRSLDSGIWSTTPPTDPSAVRAVAVDCRNTDSGKDFVLNKEGTLVAYVHLKATTDASCVGRTEKNEGLISKRMFTGNMPAASDTTAVQTANRKVKLLAANLSIEKTCDTKYGTKKDRPAEIGNDANKQLTYTIKVTNNAKKSESLPDVTRIHVKDVLPKGMTLVSPSDMTVESSSLGVKPGTKIGNQSVVSYQTGSDGVSFDISKLPSEGSVSITVPVVRKDPVNKTTCYVNTATIETVGNATDGQSSSTYQKTSVTTMPLAGAGGFAGLVVAGCVVLGASAFAWVRRRRHE